MSSVKGDCGNLQRVPSLHLDVTGSLVFLSKEKSRSIYILQFFMPRLPPPPPSSTKEMATLFFFFSVTTTKKTKTKTRYVAHSGGEETARR